ncbi:hypothetical protein CO2235_MP80122 [Cupriavidus oxalaticus]|uniref:Uncharacterized protein n=1 Tax=Cupriavidus oxalaticus TaxID=96344 RepID=A0A375FV33_9BURK|nr:hypothetical protein CO2235_U840071 [Cupriavidus oxalaticus]SPC24242.1 hypothetical protein CO2235_MP80122 [Cupriavidus oxalaticus]
MGLRAPAVALLIARSLNRVFREIRGNERRWGRHARQLAGGSWHFLSPVSLAFTAFYRDAIATSPALTCNQNYEMRWDTQYVIYQVSQGEPAAGFSLARRLMTGRNGRRDSG